MNRKLVSITIGIIVVMVILILGSNIRNKRAIDKVFYKVQKSSFKSELIEQMQRPKFIEQVLLNSNKLRIVISMKNPVQTELLRESHIITISIHRFQIDSRKNVGLRCFDVPYEYRYIKGAEMCIFKRDYIHDKSIWLSDISGVPNAQIYMKTNLTYKYMEANIGSTYLYQLPKEKSRDNNHDLDNIIENSREHTIKVVEAMMDLIN